MKITREFLRLYVIPIVLLAGIILTVAFTVLFTSTSHMPDGRIVSSNWPKDFTLNFSSELIIKGETISVCEEGLKKLDQNGLWLQVLNADGKEILGYNKPASMPTQYNPQELLGLFQEGTNEYSVFLSLFTTNDTTYTYLIGFPLPISKVLSYVDDSRYQVGKYLIIATILLTLILLVLLTVFYYIRMNKTNRQHTLDEKAKEEWLANITHDLKTPLAPIRGYAELISENTSIEKEKLTQYSKTILKNVLYTEQLVDDLKLTYQLQSNMLPLHKESGNFSRFIKEMIIDVLNSPEYETREISFVSEPEEIFLDYDEKLFKRAFLNLLINALKHNTPDTQIEVSVSQNVRTTLIVQDNGSGMEPQELEGLFTRYYRGTSTEVKAEGSGLGMAIAKQIVESHGGTITADSAPLRGTTITIRL